MKKKIVIVIIIAFVFTLIIKNAIERHHLNRENKYTIGYVNEIKSIRQGYALEYYYVVRDKKYSGSEISDKFDKGLEGYRFYVKYYPKNPRNAQIVLTKRVPDSINTAPKDGWLKIPTYESYFHSK